MGLLRRLKRAMIGVLVLGLIVSVCFVACSKKEEVVVKGPEGETVEVSQDEGKIEMKIEGPEGEGVLQLDESKGEMTITGMEGEEEVNIKSSEEGLTMTRKDESGAVEEFTLGQELPEDFRNDIPIFKDAKVMSSLSTEKGNMVSLSSEEPLATVKKFYQEELENQKWEIKDTQDVSMNQMEIAGFQCEKDQVKLTINLVSSLDKDGNKITQITLTVEE